MHVGCWIQQVTATVGAVTCWIQQVTAIVGAVTCWIQQPVYFKYAVGFSSAFNSEVDQLISKALVPPVAKKNEKIQNQDQQQNHNNHMYITSPRQRMSPKGRTKLIIGVPGAKLCKESFAEVQKLVNPQKPSENCKKHRYFAVFWLFSFFLFFARAKRRTELKL